MDTKRAKVMAAAAEARYALNRLLVAARECGDADVAAKERKMRNRLHAAVDLLMEMEMTAVQEAKAHRAVIEVTR